MLSSLYIKNYVLIEDAEINFGSGMNAITGETGAGKSIIIGALGLVLGERADSNSVGNFSQKCIIEAAFNVNENIVKFFFEENNLDAANPLTIRREITSQGKSRCFINDSPVTLQQVKILAAKLVNLHSQHETIELFESHMQLEMLDAVAGTTTLFSSYKKMYSEFSEKKSVLEKLKILKENSFKEFDYIQFLYNELSEAQLKENEQDDLEIELNNLENAGEISRQCGFAANVISTGEQPINEILSDVVQKLKDVSKYNEQIKELCKRIESCRIELKDVGDEFENISSEISSNPERIEIVNHRLNTLYQLQTKHRLNSVKALMDEEEQLLQKLNSFSNTDDEILKLEKELEEMYSEIFSVSKKLSEKRMAAKSIFEKNIMKLLPLTGLEKATFTIQIKNSETPTNCGIDEVKFLFSANKGQTPLPLSEAASGGELSRLMLCIKTCIAGKIEMPCLIFDEIDTGISGETAIRVGNMMKELSARHQLICITHLPQIAGKSAIHFYVTKKEVSGLTYTTIHQLNSKQQREEIARMLGGDNYSNAAVKTAEELMK